LKNLSQPLSKSDISQRIITFLNHKNVILCLWVLLALVISIKQSFQDTNNNYLIFKYTYFHAIDHLPLYDLYPNEYGDSNHYGPFFSLLIAPFALLPDYFGMLCWQLANILFLYFAIKQLPIEKTKINVVYWVITHELLTAMFALQFNISIAAIIVLAYVLIEKERNFWAVFVIVLGTFVKLYGIVGLAFFFFAKKKWKFIIYFVFWMLVFLIVPMLFFSPHYIIQSYHEWYTSLAQKELLNASLTSRQDISVMGMVRSISRNANIPNYPFLLVGIALFSLPYLRIKQFKEPVFRLLYLASTLIFTVIFSNSSESPTYIIAFVGVAIWFILQQRPLKPITIALLVFALILTSFSPSDLFPRYLKQNYIIPYNLKAFPCILIWLVITFQLIFKKYSPTHIKSSNE
jgi:hypothetical protein